MKVREIPKDKIKECKFHDVKGNWIPHEIVTTRLDDWEIYAAPATEEIKLIAPVEQCKEFMRDAIGSLKGKNLATVKEISDSLHLVKWLVEAWLWSCAEHGLTQRESPLGCEDDLWVME